MGISLCLVITHKSEKSKFKTHAGKLKPTCMSTGENDRKVATTPIQQNKALFKDIGRNVFFHNSGVYVPELYFMFSSGKRTSKKPRSLKLLVSFSQDVG